MTATSSFSSFAIPLAAGLLLTPLAIKAQTAPAAAPAAAPAPATNAAPVIPPPPPPFVSPAVDHEQVPWGITTSGTSSGTYPEWHPKMGAIGVRWVRTFPEWGGIENPKGTFHFDWPDAMVASATANNLEVSGLVFGKCPWGPGGMHAFPMQNLNDWTDYAAAISDRYKGRIHYWEVWNEGNGGFNDGHNVTADYANLVAAAYAGVKKSDPTALVGISVASFDPAYVDQTIVDQAKAGKPGSFDYICIHPYETFGGIDSPDGEVPYLWMTHMLRDELKADAPPDKANAPIWITEVGRPVGKSTNDAGLALGMSPDEVDAAKAVVKAYIMAMAQGIARICWFEANDPDPHREPGGYGLVDFAGKPRPSYNAMKAMTDSLGETPKYQGWLALGAHNRSFGFVFQGAAGPVLVAWMPAGMTDNTISFTGDVKVVDTLTNTSTSLKAGQTLALTNTPVLVVGLPNDLLTQAQANAARIFPWGGDYSKATSVSTQFGDPNGYGGVYGPGGPIHKFDDGSVGVVVQGKIGSSAGFSTHPSFAGILNREYYIRIAFRRLTAGNVGMNFKYEVADSQGKGPLRNNGGWYSVGPDLGWQTRTWHVTDAAFAKMWDFDFSVAPEQSVPFVIGKVEVSTQPFAK